MMLKLGGKYFDGTFFVEKQNCKKLSKLKKFKKLKQLKKPCGTH